MIVLNSLNDGFINPSEMFMICTVLYSMLGSECILNKWYASMYCTESIEIKLKGNVKQGYTKYRNKN